MPPPDKFPEDERPTRPDRGAPCEACLDTEGKPRGFVTHTTLSGETRLVTCDTCWGVKIVDRETLARYRALKG